MYLLKPIAENTGSFGLLACNMEPEFKADPSSSPRREILLRGSESGNRANGNEDRERRVRFSTEENNHVVTSHQNNDESPLQNDAQITADQSLHATGTVPFARPNPAKLLRVLFRNLQKRQEEDPVESVV